MSFIIIIKINIYVYKILLTNRTMYGAKFIYGRKSITILLSSSSIFNLWNTHLKYKYNLSTSFIK